MLRQPKKEPRVTVIRPLQSHPWGEYSFCVDTVGDWVEVYQRSEQYRPMGADDGGCYPFSIPPFFCEIGEGPAFYRDSMQMPVVTSWMVVPESGLPPPLCRRLYGYSAKDGEHAPGPCADHH